MNTLFDIHTHRCSSTMMEGPTLRLVSISLSRSTDREMLLQHLPDAKDGCYFSVGVHPWDEPMKPLENILAEMETLSKRRDVIAIGEAGMDALRGVALEIQEARFVAQAKLAEQLQIPLVVHQVKTLDRLYALHRQLSPSVAWVIHGFRGKPQQAAQWLRLDGVYLSFGQYFREESLLSCPQERFLVETDESDISLYDRYKEIARACGITVDRLAALQSRNWHTIFGANPHKVPLFG